MSRRFVGIRLAAAAALAMSVFGIGAGHAQDEIDKTLVNAEAAGGMEQLAAKAKEEGALLIYGAPAADKMAEWFAGFEEKYGIPVQYYRAPTNQIYQRYSQEQSVGRKMADGVIFSVYEVVQDANSKGWIAEYTPQTADKFPEEAVIPGRAYPAYLTVQSIGWNTSLVPEDLQKALTEDPLQALLDPRLKDKIAIVSVTAGGAQIAGSANLALHQAEQYGWEYLEKLAGQNPVVINTSPALLEAIIAGDYWATFDGYDSIFAPAIVEGAPLAFAPPKIAAATEFYMSVAANAAHPYASRLLMEWMTSEEAQNSLANISQAAVTIEGWQDEREIAKQPWFRKAEQLWFGAATDPQLQGENLKAFYERWQSIFGN